MQVLANGNKTYLLEAQRTLFNAGSGAMYLRLYKNNYTPLGTSVAADFTEANFDGYAAIRINDFGAAALDGSNQAHIDAPIKTFTCTGATTSNDIYGYYYTRADDGTLVSAERNAAGPFTINAAGLTYSVVPRWYLDTLT